VTAPAAARAAATILVLREGAGEPEVLMGRRHAGHKFMPNSLVFPGGAVDSDDHAGVIASPFPPHVVAILERQDDGTLPHALGVALCRELEEETGLTLGRPPRLDGVDYLCRAITPSIRPRRFDARFFVVSADCLQGNLAGSGELEDLRYLTVRDVLSTELEMATRGGLEQLGRWLAMSPRERCDRVTTPVMRERVWAEE
jgi:8-oxo-dGTP pyrophosphatase MutT (NUDIX family)